MSESFTWVMCLTLEVIKSAGMNIIKSSIMDIHQSKGILQLGNPKVGLKVAYKAFINDLLKIN